MTTIRYVCRFVVTPSGTAARLCGGVQRGCRWSAGNGSDANEVATLSLRDCFRVDHLWYI